MAFDKEKILEIIKEIAAYYSPPMPFDTWYSEAAAYETQELAFLGTMSTDSSLETLGDVVREADMLELVRDCIYGKVGGAVKAADIASAATKAETTNQIIIQQSSAGAEDGDFSAYGVFPVGPMHKLSADIPVDKMCVTAGSNSWSTLPAGPDGANGIPVPMYNIVSTQCLFSKKMGDAQALTVFLNAIPTVEWSRCVPYVDIQFLIPKATDTSTGANTINSPNIYRFLMGNDGLSAARQAGGAASSTIDLALDPAVAHYSEAEAGETGDEDTSIWAEQSTTLRGDASMEVFLSPQTMVNADERSGNADRYGGFQDGGTVGVLDPFRPFMSLMALNLTVQPEVNEIVFTSGTVSFTLHDRSRLAEIAAITSPGQFGKMTLLIEYGWSHPGGESPFGAFINTLRRREHYMVSSASYSFTQSGEVSITLNIHARGASQVIQEVHILDDKIADKQKLIAELVAVMYDVAARLPEEAGDVGYPNTRPKKFLTAVASEAGVHGLSMNVAEVVELKTFIAELRDSTDPTLEAAGEHLDSVFDGGGAAAWLASGGNTGGATALAEKIALLKSSPDPWLMSNKYGKCLRDNVFNMALELEKYHLDGYAKTYTSLAKLMTIFIGIPLRMDNRFSEIQFIWGPLNGNASYAANMNLASFPIPISAFEAGMTRISKANGPNLTVGQFTEFINNYFVNNYANHVYGFNRNGHYKVAFDEDTGALSYELASTAENAYARASEHEQGVLNSAYDGAGGVFEPPMVSLMIEAAPIDHAGDLADVTADSGSEALKAKTILRIFFSDEKEDANPGAIDLLGRIFEDKLPDDLPERPDAAEAHNADGEESDATKAYNLSLAQTYKAAEDMGLLKTGPDGIPRFAGPHHWKKLLKDTGPYVDIGSNFCSIIECGVQNMETGDLQTVMMLNAEDPGDGAGGVAKMSLPMAMMPQQLDLTMFGCPIIAPFHSLFVDLRTGTDIDCVYNLTTVSHAISPGSFKTSATCLARNGSYAQFAPMSRSLKNLADFIASKGETVTTAGHADVVQASIDDPDVQAASGGAPLETTQAPTVAGYFSEDILTGLAGDAPDTRMTEIAMDALAGGDLLESANAKIIESYNLQPITVGSSGTTVAGISHYFVLVDLLGTDILQITGRIEKLEGLGFTDVAAEEAKLETATTALVAVANALESGIASLGTDADVEGLGRHNAMWERMKTYYKDTAKIDVLTGATS